ncbi:MAG: triose-phosphate isomerase [Oscillospiraceae bacterium]|jgi:triosephosphate isomerase|nr:triose-phosphate isomerase [Oscillospiraceae bacterium]
MTRRKLIAGNWKMYKTAAEAVSFANEFVPLVSSLTKADVCLCVPFVHLLAVGDIFEDTGVKLGAQNVHYEQEGAFTGEVSCRMLSEAGVKYVIIGHSERRAYFFETDDMINKKMRAAINAQLNPILCVGENLEDRESGAAQQVVLRQLTGALADVNITSLQRVTVAYEPVWAIGTGRTALPMQAREMCAFIRSKIEEMYDGRAASKIRCIYGGSVNPVTARDIIGNEDVDGALVGGASLKPGVFADIVKAVS